MSFLPSIGPDFNVVKVSLIDQVHIHVGRQRKNPTPQNHSYDPVPSMPLTRAQTQAQEERAAFVKGHEDFLGFILPVLTAPTFGAAFYSAAQEGVPIQNMPMVAGVSLAFMAVLGFMPVAAEALTIHDYRKPEENVTYGEIFGKPIKHALTVAALTSVFAWSVGNMAHHNHFNLTDNLGITQTENVASSSELQKRTVKTCPINPIDNPSFNLGGCF